MNTKTILAISIAAAFMVSTMGMAYAVGHLGIMDTDVETKVNSKGNPNERIKVHIEVGAGIPLDGTMGFGYGIMTDKTPGAGEAPFTLEPDNVHVLVTHLPIDDTAAVEDDSGLHTHVLDLKDATSACTAVSADFEVDVMGSLANKGFDLDSDWEVDGNTAWIGFVPTKLLNSGDVDVIVSFMVIPVPSDAMVFDDLTNLCIKTIDLEDLSGT